MARKTVRYTYRIRVSKRVDNALVREYGLCRAVWNHLVAESRNRHQQRRAFEHADLTTLYMDQKGILRDYFEFGYNEASRLLTMLRHTLVDESGRQWLAEGSAVTQQQMVRNFASARRRALMEQKNQIPTSRRHGLPKFKSQNTSLPSLNYSKDGFKLVEIDGRTRLKLAGGTLVSVVWSRRLPSVPKSVRVYKDSLGHWYASFVVILELVPMPGPPHAAIGIDWGVATTATTVHVDTVTGKRDFSDSYDLSHPQFGKAAAAELAAAQKRMARRRRPKDQPRTKGYARAQREAAKVYKRVANQRRDTGHKWARRVVAAHSKIAVEDFRPKFLAKTTMVKKSADAGIALLKNILIWQATIAGIDLRLVDPRYTTTDCADCDARTKHHLPLGQRTYTCESCGVSRSRDKNSAAVMVARAGFIPAGAEDVRPQKAAVPSRQSEPGIPRLVRERTQESCALTSTHEMSR